MKRIYVLNYKTLGVTGAMLCGLTASGQDSGFSAADQRPNILFIVSEDNGLELGCYGAPVKSPNLDRLASSGTLFSNAYVPQAGSSPSRASFLTGLYPHQNGQVGLATWRYSMYDPQIVNLINELKKGGYRTGMIGKLHVNPESAFDLDYHKMNKGNFKRNDLDDYARFAMDFIMDGDEPFYLQVNFPDAHDPYIPQAGGLPENPLNASDVETLPFVGLSSEKLLAQTAAYYNCMMRLDSLIGTLIDRLKESGKFDNTLIVYIGDHGPHMFRGKMTCYEGGTHIPMLVSWKNAGVQGQVYDGLTSTLDLFPTFMEVAGLDVPDHLPGKSLKDVIVKGSRKAVRKYLFTEYNVHFNANPYPTRTIRDGRYKLIWNLLSPVENPAFVGNVRHLVSDEEFRTMLDEAAPEICAAYRNMLNPKEFELYDLRCDPYEWKNLSDDPAYRRVKNRLLRKLKKWQVETGDPFTDIDKARRFYDDVLRFKTEKVEIPYHEYMDPKCL